MAKQVINLGTGRNTPGGDDSFGAWTKAKSNFDELYEGAVPQFTVSAGNTLALVRATHQGATIILAGAGAGISLDAAAQGDGLAVKIINDTGSAYTVPSFTGGTARYDAAGHTKISAGGSAGMETYTRAGTRYVHISGTTE